MLAHFEKLRSDKLFKSAVMIQNMRKRFYRKRYLETRASHIQLQGLIRGYMSRKRVREEEQERVAATLIQTSIRGYLARKQFAQTVLSVVTIQNLSEDCKQEEIT